MPRRDNTTTSADSDRDSQKENKDTANHISNGKLEAPRRGAGVDKTKSKRPAAETDEEEEERSSTRENGSQQAEDDEEDDQGEGSPRGTKRARSNTQGDATPGATRSAPRVQVKTQPRDTDGYIPGSIVRIQLENFVTYDYVEFRPGPYLNMILGPNGTGKSSIACAICLGLNFSTELLGRATAINLFVKNTAQKGYIEIELKGSKGKPNVSIRRNLTSKSKSSSFTINGKSATGREVTEQVEKLNVQVGNLCTFLPQDKVSHFAAMSPQQLLKETQKAAGNENLTRWHETLISSGKELREVQESLNSDRDTLKTAQDRNAALERDVERFKERKKLEEERDLLNVLIPVQQYREMRQRYLELKAKQRDSLTKLTALKNKNQPVIQFKETLEARFAKAHKRREELKAQMLKKMQKMRQKYETNTKYEEKTETLQNELENLKRKEKQRQKQIKEAEQKIVKIQEQIDQLKTVKVENDEEVRDEMRQINLESHDVRTRYDALQAKQHNNADKIVHLRSQVRAAELELRKLDDVGNRRLQAFANYNRDHYDAVMWLRSHRNLFRMEVFEPLYISISVPQRQHAMAIEGLLDGTRLKMFVAQCQEDYDTLNKHLNDDQCLGRRVRINTWYKNVANQRLHPPPMSAEELQQFGFFGYALDFIECPEGLKTYLAHDVSLHRNAIGSDRVDVESAMEAVGNKGGAQFVSGKTLNIVKRSPYGNRALINSTRDLNPARVFIDVAVDSSAKEKWDQQRKDALTAISVIEEDDKALANEDKVIKQEDSQFQARLNACKKRRDDIRDHHTRVTRANANLKAAERTYKDHINAPSSEESRKKIKRELNDITQKRVTLAKECAQLAREVTDENTAATRAGLQSLQIAANKTVLAELCEKKDRKFQVALLEFNRINEEYTTCKNSSVQHLESYKIIVNGLEGDLKQRYHAHEDPRQRYDAACEQAKKAGRPKPPVPEGLEQRSSTQMQEDLEAAEAKLELSTKTNGGVIEQYERRKTEIENLSQTIDEKERRAARIDKEIKNAKDHWYPSLQALVTSIGKKFSVAFDRIGCAGEVRIGEHEDFDKWTIDILVKFRSAEKLQLLTAQRQSGGERALTTILYLLSLTEEARAPFSLVDEINQGMDARAERMVHNSMVQVTCQEDSAQYFLITPKLLADLDYHKRMKVLCVNNGEWLPEEKGMGNMMDLIDGYLKTKGGRAASSSH